MGSGLWARPRRTAFQSLVEGVWIRRKIWPAKERSPAGEMEQSSRSFAREGWNWNLPVVMRWAWSCFMLIREVHFCNNESN